MDPKLAKQAIAAFERQSYSVEFREAEILIHGFKLTKNHRNKAIYRVIFIAILCGGILVFRVLLKKPDVPTLYIFWQCDNLIFIDVFYY